MMMRWFLNEVNLICRLILIFFATFYREQVTLGPKGRNAIISQPYGPPKITKDGVTVAKAIDFEDKFEDMGAQLIKSVASKTNDIAGDGTTTATVLARAIYAEGCKAVAAGLNPLDLRRGIQLAVNKVVSTLEEISRPINSKEEISQVNLFLLMYNLQLL